MACITNADCGWHACCPLGGGFCEPVHLFEHPAQDILMGATSFVVAGVSLAAGVGGGGVFVPLLMIVLSFDARGATALSQAMLLGGALAAFIYNLDHHHPRVQGRPLVDFQLACLMGPALMSGAQLGSVLHQVTPPAVLLVVLMLVLIDSARKGVANALKIRAQEKARGDSEPLKAAKPKSHSSASETDSDSSDDEASIRISGAKGKLFFIWLFTMGITMAKALLFDICSYQWWAMVFIAVGVLGGFAYWYALKLSQEEPADEFMLDFRELAMTLLRWSFLAGVIAAVCGIGGGMIMGPILVGLKVPPPVSAATTATTLLVLSSSMALLNICRGFAPAHYSVFLSMCTTTGALAGKVLIGRWVRRTGKESIVVWCLAGITILSTVLLGSMGAWTLWTTPEAAFSFGDLCAVDQDSVAVVPQNSIMKAAGNCTESDFDINGLNGNQTDIDAFAHRVADCGWSTISTLFQWQTEPFIKCVQGSGMTYGCAACSEQQGRYGYDHCKLACLGSWCSSVCLSCASGGSAALYSCMGRNGTPASTC